MTKKELNLIVEGIVAAVVLKATEGCVGPDGTADTYEPSTSEHDEARTLVGIALRRNRAAILAAIPVFAPMASATPVAAVAPATETIAVS